MIIVDTNILSELMRHAPDRNVVAWVGRHREGGLATTCVSEAEILAGIETMPLGRRRDRLAEMADLMFQPQFRNLILALNREAAKCYAVISASRRRGGRPMAGFDGLIAAIAMACGARVATRDTGGFADCGLQVINPWIE